MRTATERNTARGLVEKERQKFHDSQFYRTPLFPNEPQTVTDLAVKYCHNKRSLSEKTENQHSCPIVAVSLAPVARTIQEDGRSVFDASETKRKMDQKLFDQPSKDTSDRKREKRVSSPAASFIVGDIRKTMVRRMVALSLFELFPPPQVQPSQLKILGRRSDGGKKRCFIANFIDNRDVKIPLRLRTPKLAVAASTGLEPEFSCKYPFSPFHGHIHALDCRNPAGLNLILSRIRHRAIAKEKACNPSEEEVNRQRSPQLTRLDRIMCVDDALAAVHTQRRGQLSPSPSNTDIEEGTMVEKKRKKSAEVRQVEETKTRAIELNRLIPSSLDRGISSLPMVCSSHNGTNAMRKRDTIDVRSSVLAPSTKRNKYLVKLVLSDTNTTGTLQRVESTVASFSSGYKPLSSSSQQRETMAQPQFGDFLVG